MTSRTRERLRALDEDRIAARIRDAGVSGAGGGGFPTYAKWQRLDEVDALLVNHQESEPNNHVDKWLADEYAEEYAEFLGGLLEFAVDLVVVGAKRKDRDPHLLALEEATGGTVREPEDLPVDADAASGVVFAYTDDTYEYGMENVLLQVATGTIIGKDLPVDYGWIVQNTETVHNLRRALVEGVPVTHTYVHVDGFRSDGSRVPHRMLEVPTGTPATAVLDAAGIDTADLAPDRVLAHGGPGWCFEVEGPPSRFGVGKNVNCLLVLGADVVAENTYGNDRIDVLDAYDWSHPDPATEPTDRLTPEVVRVPLITNDTYEGVVVPSDPVVDPGARVTRGDPVAGPAPGGFSPVHHASIHGEVTAVGDRHVEIRRRE